MKKKSCPKSERVLKKQKDTAAFFKSKKKGNKKKKITESTFLLGFIKSLVDKNYKQADKYLQQEVDGRIKDRIKDTVAKLDNKK